MDRVRIVISRCLLGERTRYDGDVRPEPALVGFLAKHCELVPVCPEVECGLPVPREPMRLVDEPLFPRLLGGESGADLTFRLLGFACGWLDGLAGLGAHGAVLKARSPSCAVRPIPVFDRRGRTIAQGQGLFARAFCERFPLAPVADEDLLDSDRARQEFLARALRSAQARILRGRSLP